MQFDDDDEVCPHCEQTTVGPGSTTPPQPRSTLNSASASGQR